MSDATATPADPTNDGRFKKFCSAIKAKIDPDGTLKHRAWLATYKVMRWPVILAVVGLLAWLGFTWNETRNQVETLRQEKVAIEALRKSDIAALNSTMAVHLQHRADLRKHNAELLLNNRDLGQALARKSAVQHPRPENPQLKADLKQSLKRNMVLQRRLKKFSASPTAKSNARLKAKAKAKEKADHQALFSRSQKVTELTKKAGQLRNALQIQKEISYNLRLEMEMLQARECLKQWGQIVAFKPVYYRCAARSGDVLKMVPLGRRNHSGLSIHLIPGDGSRRGLFITNRTYYLPSGLYDIEIWKNGKRSNLSDTPCFLSANPGQKYIACPDGSRIPIPHQGNVNLILLSTDGYKLTSLPNPF